MADREPLAGPAPAIAPRHAELQALYAYWLGKAAGRRAPARADIEPLEIAPFLPHVGLVDVTWAPLRFRFRLLGTEAVRGLGRDPTGHYLDQLERIPHLEAIVAEYTRVAERAEPVCGVWEYTREDGRHVSYERLALPLSSDGKTVDMLFGGIVFDAAYG